VVIQAQEAFRTPEDKSRKEPLYISYKERILKATRESTKSPTKANPSE
jgi:hypothetical protein